MDYLKLLLLKIDCSQDVLTRDMFHNLIKKLKVYPEYYKTIISTYK
jgi:hypothetical protein